MHNKQMQIINNIMFRWISVSVILFIFSFPFPHHVLPNLGDTLSYPFEKIATWFGDNVLKINNYTKQFDSDSTGFYIHVLLLFFSSFFIGLGTLFIKIKSDYLKISKNIFFVFVSYYLGSVLLMYGFDKVFKHQFYLPEPNTLFTPLGDLSKDIAFWSVMGASRSYSVFSGIIEVIPGVLLLFKRTRFLGALIALFVLINVVMLNFSFDISVKVFSLFLLMLSVVLLIPYRGFLVSLFLSKTYFKTEEKKPVNKNYWFLKIGLIILLLVDSLMPYIATNNFNDDLAKRPLFHGAYSIKNSNNTIKNIFVHRKGYMIFLLTNDKMIDYKIYNDTLNNQITLVDYTKTAFILSYKAKNNHLTQLKGSLGAIELNVYLFPLQWEQKPLLSDSFCWTID